MVSRRQLHEKLCDILGTRNVYFQPPASIKMKYPAIVYTRNGYYRTLADNGVYHNTPRYLMTYISEDPDDQNVTKFSDMSNVRWSRNYATDGLNHDVFEIY